MTRKTILALLMGGNRRSIGRLSEVVQHVLAEPVLFDTGLSDMSAGGAVLCMC